MKSYDELAKQWGCTPDQVRSATGRTLYYKINSGSLPFTVTPEEVKAELELSEVINPRPKLSIVKALETRPPSL